MCVVHLLDLAIPQLHPLPSAIVNAIKLREGLSQKVFKAVEDRESQGLIPLGQQHIDAVKAAILSEFPSLKKSKAAKLLNALKPGQNEIPKELVDKVMERVRAEHGEGAPGTDEETVRMALEQLKVMDVVKGKAGFSGRGQKDLGTHKVP